MLRARRQSLIICSAVSAKCMRTDYVVHNHKLYSVAFQFRCVVKKIQQISRIVVKESVTFVRRFVKGVWFMPDSAKCAYRMLLVSYAM